MDVNLFGDIVIPDRQSSPRTNAAAGPGSIGAQSDLCKQTWGRKPNMILIDYFGNGLFSLFLINDFLKLIPDLKLTVYFLGDAMTAQNNLNGI